MTDYERTQIVPGGAAVHDRAAEIRTKLSQLILEGRPYMKVAEQLALAVEIGCHVNSVRRQLVRMKLIGRLARGLGESPRAVRAKNRAKEQRALLSEQWAEAPANPQTQVGLAQAQVLLETQLLDARDPIQRLELLNKLATNARGDVPPAVQVAALTKIGDEYNKAGEGFGIPGPSNDEEEGQRVLAVLQSAKPECAQWAISKFQEVPCTPSDSTPDETSDICTESDSRTPSPVPQEPSTDAGSGTPSTLEISSPTIGCSTSPTPIGAEPAGPAPLTESAPSLESTRDEPTYHLPPEPASIDQTPEAPQAPPPEVSGGDGLVDGGVG